MTTYLENIKIQLLPPSQFTQKLQRRIPPPRSFFLWLLHSFSKQFKSIQTRRSSCTELIIHSKSLSYGKTFRSGNCFLLLQQLTSTQTGPLNHMRTVPSVLPTIKVKALLIPSTIQYYLGDFFLETDAQFQPPTDRIRIFRGEAKGFFFFSLLHR